MGAVDLKEFLKHYIKEKKGKVLNKKGEEIGFHDGAVFHTLGERHGFTITKKSPNDNRYFVVGKDIKKNILIVSQAPDVGRLGSLDVQRLEHTNWINGVPEKNKIYTAQIRYHGELLLCKVKILFKNKAKIISSKPILVASGQSCVIYDKDVCLGGGVVVDGVPYSNSARTISK